jgi:hypothetical protein
MSKDLDLFTGGYVPATPDNSLAMLGGTQGSQSPSVQINGDSNQVNIIYGRNSNMFVEPEPIYDDYEVCDRVAGRIAEDEFCQTYCSKCEAVGAEYDKSSWYRSIPVLSVWGLPLKIALLPLALVLKPFGSFHKGSYTLVEYDDVALLPTTPQERPNSQSIDISKKTEFERELHQQQIKELEDERYLLELQKDVESKKAMLEAWNSISSSTNSKPEIEAPKEPAHQSNKYSIYNLMEA